MPSAEGHRRLGALLCQGIQAGSLSATENNRQDLSHITSKSYGNSLRKAGQGVPDDSTSINRICLKCNENSRAGAPKKLRRSCPSESDRISLRKGLNLLPVGAPQQDRAQDHRHHVGKGKAQPHQVQVPRPGQNPGQRQQHHQLAGEGHVHAQHAPSQGLEYRAADDAVARHQKAEADNLECRQANLHHLRGCLEQGQQDMGEKLEEDESHQHDGRGVDGAEDDGLPDPQPVPGAIVVGDDGNHAIVQAEYRHEHKAHELDVDPQHGIGGVSEAQKNPVHKEIHDGYDGGHDDGGHTDGIDGLDGLEVGAESPDLQPHLMVSGHIEEDRQQHSRKLADDRSPGSPRNAQGRKAQVAENQDGVQDDVDDGSGSLGKHGVDGLAGSLEHPVVGNLHEQAEAEDGADPQIVAAIPDNLRVGGLALEVQGGEKESEDNEQQAAAGRKENSVGGNHPHRLEVLAPQVHGQQGVDSHTGSRGDGNHQVLDGEGQGDGGEGLLPDP